MIGPTSALIIPLAATIANKSQNPGSDAFSLLLAMAVIIFVSVIIIFFLNKEG